MFLQQLGQASRTLANARRFTLAAILTLALGIGGTVAMFSLLNAVLLKPLPYPEPERLMFINTAIPKLKNSSPMLHSRAGYVLRWRTELKSFESIGAAIVKIMTLTEGNQAESVATLRMTAELYDVLGQQPALGRWFLRTEEENGQPDVVVLSNGLWRSRFSGDPGVLGRNILLDGRPHEVVGVAPPGPAFYGGQIDVPLSESPDVFIPLRVPPGELDFTTVGSTHWCAVVARLRRSVTQEQALAELEGWMAAISRMNREKLEIHAFMQPLQKALVGNARRVLQLLMAAVGLVLLIACANIANLILVRATRTRHERAVRMALGASRRHLISQSLAESLLIAVPGTVLGLLAASWIVDVVVMLAPARLPRLEAISVDRNVMVFSFALCLLTTILFGLLPASEMSKASSVGSLHAAVGWQTDGPYGGKLRAALISMEAGLATVLLIGAGLLLLSLERVLNVPRGFEAENIHAVVLALPPKYQTPEQKVAFFRRLDESVSSVPGIRQAGYANAIPLLAGASMGSIAPAIKEGTDEVPFGEQPMASWLTVSSGYLPTLAIPLRAGRLFDAAETRPVAVVSETAARRIWPGEDPIGKKVRHSVDRAGEFYFTVIGVVGDVHTTALDKPADCLIYLPYWHRYYPRDNGPSLLALYIRSAMDSTAAVAAIREQVRNVDPDVAAQTWGTLSRIVFNSLSQRRFQALMVAAFGFVALALAAIGVYGVVSHSIAQRRREIGVRMVLGANRRDITHLALRQGMKPVLTGMAIGLVSATASAPQIKSLLFEVRDLDPFVFAAAPLVLVMVAALACYAPASRSSRIDPAVALRHD